MSERGPEQIIGKLREGERQLSAGAELPGVLKHLEITKATWHRWRNQFGGMKADKAKRLTELERENAQLKKVFNSPPVLTQTARMAGSIAKATTR